MANPNNSVGTNGAFGGRTSVNAFNDVLSAFVGRGIISGWNCVPSSGLPVALGGNGTTRDVAIAEDASGNKTTINNISQNPVLVTVNAAPASNSRIDAIIAYVEDSPNGSGVTDNPDVVNLLVVSGTVASSPTAPSDSAIRSAITADGASGSTAYYVALATVRIPAGTTDIDATMVNSGDKVSLIDGVTLTESIADEAVTTGKIANAAVTASKIDFSTFLGSLFPVATSTIQLGWDVEIPIVRVCNIVIVTWSFVTAYQEYDEYGLAETCPDGFKPASTVFLPFVSSTNASGQVGGWTLNSDGAIKFSCNSTTTVAQRYMTNGCWITNDAWPSN